MLWLLLDRGIGEEERGCCAKYPRSYSARGTVHSSATAAARVVGALGTPAAGLCPRPAREKGFLSNRLLD